MGNKPIRSWKQEFSRAWSMSEIAPVSPTSTSYTQTVTRIHNAGGEDNKNRVVETTYVVTLYTSDGGLQTSTNSHQVNYLI